MKSFKVNLSSQQFCSIMFLNILEAGGKKSPLWSLSVEKKRTFYFSSKEKMAAGNKA